MTGADRNAYNENTSISQFSSSFAPRRLLATLDFERAGLFTPDGVLAAALMGQFDFTGEEYHSQYLLARYSLPLGDFDLETGVAAELMENAGRIQFSMTALLKTAWTPPSPWTDRLELGLRWASGDWNETFTAFSPLSTVSQGSILRAKLSGLMTGELEYRVRFLESLSGAFNVFAFLRNDTISFRDAELDTGSSPWVGAEANAELLWAPVTDLSLTLGAGVFLPGNAMQQDAAPRWRVSLGLLFAL
jgi:hypothetical protein